MLSKCATTDIYTFISSEGKRVPHDATRVSINESIEEIGTDTFNKYKSLDKVIIHNNVVQIKEELFNICPSL